MTKEEVIKYIISLDEPFTTSELLKSLGGRNLSIEDKKEILLTLYDLLEDGMIMLRPICDTYYYIKLDKINKLKLK